MIEPKRIQPKVIEAKVIGPPLLDRLRSETRDVHEALEQQLPITSPDLTLAGYRDLLERFYSFYREFEEQVMPRLPKDWAAFFENRRKVPALKSDLHFLGTSNHSLPCPSMPPYNTVPQMLGALYVLEGSTLGGQLITRHVQQVLGLDEHNGCQFFSGYGSETVSKWKSFREQLMRSSSPQTNDEIIASARRTFEAMHLCLLAPVDSTIVS